jgi:hypothetical protein
MGAKLWMNPARQRQLAQQIRNKCTPGIKGRGPDHQVVNSARHYNTH